jgi:transposase InsO family protein
VVGENSYARRRPSALAELLNRHRIEHRTIPPRRPQVNGKVERYQQTLKRE